MNNKIFIPALVAILFWAFQVFAQENEKDLDTVIEEDTAVQATKEDRFQISGFIDFQFGYSKLLSNKRVGGFQLNTNKHFSVNNLNLYLKFNISKGWEVFSEIRFLYAPTGLRTAWSDVSDPTSTVLPKKILFYPVDTSYYDNNLVLGKYGSIAIERAYIEWNRYDFAKFRVGHFLTPFGIWNQDHGAPVVTSVRTPIIVAAPIQNVGMPSSQTGGQFLGKTNIPVINTLFEYAVYVSNGNSVSDTVNDQHDNDFAFGGFLNFKFTSLAKITDLDFGGSAYHGKRTYPFYQYTVPTFLMSSTGFIFMNPYLIPSLEKYKIDQMDTIATAHIKIAFNNLPGDSTIVLQGEYLHQWVHEYGMGNLVNASGLVKKPENYLYTTTYGQFEWQFLGWLTPYFRFEYTKITSSDPFWAANLKSMNLYIGGLNFRIIPEVVLKLEYQYVYIDKAKTLWAISDPTNIAGSVIVPFRANANQHVFQASLSAAF